MLIGERPVKNFLSRFWFAVIVISGVIAMVSCGGGGGGGGGDDDSGDVPIVTTLEDTDFTTESGITDGGVTTQSTQTMRGVVPNPSGSSDTYDGKAYLVINGNSIPLDVTKAVSSSALERTVDKGDKTYVVKNGKAYLPDTESADDYTEYIDKVARDSGDTTSWVFEVTFSINAGPNTISIEVYDLQDSLFAQLSQWEVIGAIEPTSVVVTLWWNTNKTDIDLHVAELDDGGNVVAHCYYGDTWAGDMVLDYDNVYGYGPEHITVDEVVGTKTYAIKVYYFADHNVDEEGYAVEPPTPTTAHVTAEVNAETVVSDAHQLTEPNYGSSWMEADGVSVWDVGTFEASGANVYSVTLGVPDLSAYPSVQLTLDVADAEGALIEGLTDANLYVVNAGTVMSPITVVDNGNGNYTLTYSDITAGARNLYVYVYVPATSDDEALEGGLSNTVTYGTNYALLVGLNEYPPSIMNSGDKNWFDDAGGNPFVDVTVSTAPDGAGDFSARLTDNSGGTNRLAVTVGFSAMSGSLPTYRLTMVKPENYLDYDGISVYYKKQSWLNNCVNDIVDMEAALKATGTLMTNSGWLDANIHTLTNSGATEAAITAQIAAIAASMEKYDLFLFHFSGHGSDGTTDASQYLCAYEDENWISVTDLSSALADIPNPGEGDITNLYVILDACHSGNFIGRGLVYDEAAVPGKIRRYRSFLPQNEPDPTVDLKFARDLQNMDADTSNLFVMTAVTGDKSSWDDSGLGNGVFTYYLLEGMNLTGKFVSQAPANANHDCWLTAEEAFNYADPKCNAYVTVANGFPVGSVEDPQIRDNSAAKPSRLIYNW